MEWIFFLKQTELKSEIMTLQMRHESEKAMHHYMPLTSIGSERGEGAGKERERGQEKR